MSVLGGLTVSFQVHSEGMTIMAEAPNEMLDFICTLNIPNFAPQQAQAGVRIGG